MEEKAFQSIAFYAKKVRLFLKIFKKLLLPWNGGQDDGFCVNLKAGISAEKI